MAAKTKQTEPHDGTTMQTVTLSLFEGLFQLMRNDATHLVFCATCQMTNTFHWGKVKSIQALKWQARKSQGTSKIIT